VKVDAVTTWAMIDRASGRLSRVRPEVTGLFLEIPLLSGEG
jgi:acyl-CoA thioester hydrolase